MIPHLTALLILVPAPMTSEEPPTGVAPTLGWVAFKDGLLEMNQAVPYVEAYLVEESTTVDGKTVTRKVTRQRTVFKTVTVSRAIDGAEFHTAAGKKIDEADWKKALARGALVMLSGDDQLPHAAYRNTLKEGMLILVFKPVPPPIPPVNFAPPK